MLITTVHKECVLQYDEVVFDFLCTVHILVDTFPLMSYQLTISLQKEAFRETINRLLLNQQLSTDLSKAAILENFNEISGVNCKLIHLFLKYNIDLDMPNNVDIFSAYSQFISVRDNCVRKYRNRKGLGPQKEVELDSKLHDLKERENDLLHRNRVILMLYILVFRFKKYRILSG